MKRNTDEIYLDSLEKILQEGTLREDRTGTGTISLFGMQNHYDISENFPLLTSKKIYTRGVFGELLWMITGKTNATWLQDRKIRIWNEWADSNGDLGPVYGAQMRSWYAPQENMVQVDKRKDDYADYQYPYNKNFYDKINNPFNNDEAWVIENLNSNEYKVQLKSGFVTTVTKTDWEKLYKDKDYTIIDGYAKTVYGVGFMGEEVDVNDNLYILWKNIMEECYDSKKWHYKKNGGNCVIVSPVWHSFENFAKTISLVPGYSQWRHNDNLILSREYYGSKVYSPNTCIFVNKDMKINKDGKAVRIDGEMYNSVADWCGVGNDNHAKHNWNLGKEYRGVSAYTIVNPDEGKLWRKQLVVDQIFTLIENLKKDPFSRRHIVNCWNAAQIDDMALPPCHTMFQFYVTPDENGNPYGLSCQLYQRSGDYFLGVPFNIAFYSAFTYLIADILDLKPLEFVHTLGDAHIYTNHIDQVKEQLSRRDNITDSPTLTINHGDNIDTTLPNLFNHCDIDDFVIDNYTPLPAIKAPVAV